MTKAFQQQFHCPNCNTFHTAETSFGRWLRNNKQLDSRLGYNITDEDYTILKFVRENSGREVEMMMEVEVKMMGSFPSPAQGDILHKKNQLIRNRKETPTKKLKLQAGTAPLKVYSVYQRRYVQVRHFGVHLLQFSGLGPDDSESIKWDKKEISQEVLTQILRFDLDPDTLRPLTVERHHKKPLKEEPLPLLEKHSST